MNSIYIIKRHDNNDDLVSNLSFVETKEEAIKLVRKFNKEEASSLTLTDEGDIIESDENLEQMYGCNDLIWYDYERVNKESEV